MATIAGIEESTVYDKNRQKSKEVLFVKIPNAVDFFGCSLLSYLWYVNWCYPTTLAKLILYSMCVYKQYLRTLSLNKHQSQIIKLQTTDTVYENTD